MLKGEKKRKHTNNKLIHIVDNRTTKNNIGK
jgi:hypothetical protein